MFNSHKESIAVGVIVAIIFGAGGYALGATGSASLPSQGSAFTRDGMNAQFSGMGSGAGRSARANGGGFVTGAIIAQDKTSITVELRKGPQDGAGGTKIVFFSGNTQITKSTAGAIADLSIGKEVVVTGTTNTDGSLTAKTVQLRPEGLPALGTGAPIAPQAQ